MSEALGVPVWNEVPHDDDDRLMKLVWRVQDMHHFPVDQKERQSLLDELKHLTKRFAVILDNGIMTVVRDIVDECELEDFSIGQEGYISQTPLTLIRVGGAGPFMTGFTLRARMFGRHFKWRVRPRKKTGDVDHILRSTPNTRQHMLFIEEIK